VSPTVELFGKTVLPRAPSHRAVRRLHELLTALEPGPELARDVERLVAVSGFVRGGPSIPEPEGSEPGERQPLLRLRLLVNALEAFPELAARCSALLGSVLTRCSGLGLLARTGVPADRGLFGETMDRLSRRFLPEPIEVHDLAELAGRMFPAKSDLTWLASVPPSLSARFARAVVTPGATDGNPWTAVEHHVEDALALIGTRVGGVGLYDAIRERSPVVPLRGSPFFQLPEATTRLLGELSAQNPPGIAQGAADCQTLVARCHDTVAAVTTNLEQTGVSIDVVYRLELITKNLERYAALLERLSDTEPTARADGARRLLVRLLQARRKERDLGAIVVSNLHLLARKIIERAGETGEHYITSTRRDYVKMFLSAGGGGVLTAGTAALKFLISAGHFAPFVEGFLASSNYAVTFVTMQLLGFTLATKQPSMTAAALASSMHVSAGQRDLSGLVTMTARITRSQLAAAAGNIGAVIPTSLAFNAYYQQKTGHPFLDEEGAEHMLASLHPTHSGTVFFAALTGVLLWLSSVAAGWLENWAVYRRLPEAIAQHRLGRYVGRRTTAWASRVFQHNISGFGGNVAAGFLLGMTPVIGKFLGLPLEVRHVTLSTGALTLAAAERGIGIVREPAFHAAVLGIFVVFLMNLTVSFNLALAVALRAREVSWRDRVPMLVSIFVTLARSPLQFFFPPQSAGEAVHGPVTSRPPDVKQR
jgi:site-specific recombinase